MIHDRSSDKNPDPQENRVEPLDNSDMITAEFEQALIAQDHQHYYLRLFISGATPRSIKALERLKELCETHLQERYELEVIDVYQLPNELDVENIVAIPTLVKKLPLPLRRIVGDLSDTEKVLKGLDLIPKNNLQEQPFT